MDIREKIMKAVWEKLVDDLILARIYNREDDVMSSDRFKNTIETVRNLDYDILQDIYNAWYQNWHDDCWDDMIESQEWYVHERKTRSDKGVKRTK